MGQRFRDYLINELGYSKLSAVTQMDNLGSQNVLNKLGFKYLGNKSFYEYTVTYFYYYP